MTARGLELAARLSRRTGEWPDEQTCSLIARDAVRLHHLAEDDCSGAGTWFGESVESFGRRQSRHEARVEKATDEATTRVSARVASLGYRVTFQGDPRGAPFAILTDPGDSLTDVNLQHSAVWVPGI